MSNYSYVAVDPQGMESRGTLDVSDQSEALRRIKEMGLFPTKVLAADKPRHRAGRDPATPGNRARELEPLNSSLGWRHKGCHPRGLYAPTGDPDRGGHALAPRIEDLAGAGGKPGPAADHRGALACDRERQFLCRSPGSSSQDLQPASTSTWSRPARLAARWT